MFVLQNMDVKEKRKYGQWSEQDMQAAIRVFRSGKIGYNEVCRQYRIPKPTFRRHLKSYNSHANEGKKIIGRSCIFSEEIEADLEKHILKLESIFFGITITDIRKAAFAFAERKRLKHNFNTTKEMAGKKWFYAFMRRHPQLSLRQPESTSIARCRGFNRANVTEFFDILEKVVDENGLTALNIFNVDETGFSTVQKRCQKIVAKKGKSQVGVVASGERGVNTTFVCCTSPSGQYVAPMLIFKRKRMAPDLGEGAPPGSIVEISDTGYINADLFLTWLKHFIAAVKPTTENKILLILDGHTTHSRNLAAIELARENGVILLQLPGHTTHRLQPLDVAIFKPLQVYYDQAIEKWLRQNPGRAVTQFQVARFIGEAYGRAASIANAANGFRRCGIWPVDRNVFTDADFVAQDDLQTEQIIVVEKGDENNDSEDEDDIPVAVLMRQQKTRTASPTPQDISFEDILPIPDLINSNKVNSRAGKRAQTARVLTTTPYKEELEAKKSEVKGKQRNQVKRKIGQTEQNTQKKKRDDVVNAVIEVNEDEWLCSLCGECKVEDMVRCDVCHLWAHQLCANIENDLCYICDKCI